MKKLSALLLLITLHAQAVMANDGFKPADMAKEKIEASLREAISQQGVEGKLAVNINSFLSNINLKDSLDSYKVAVDEISINEKTRNFKANLAITSPENRTKSYPVLGTYDQIVLIPALAEKTARDTIIKAEDIAWIEVPKEWVKFDTITTDEKLIGQSLKRAIAANTQIKERDLQKAQLVARNTTVNIVFDTPTISLKATGIALDNGAQGDVIRVRNTSSNKIIQGIVQDDQNVAAISQATSPVAKSELPRERDKS